MTNFFTPTTKTLSMIELLSFYGLALKAENAEVATTYVFYKKNKTNSRLLKMLGFDVDKVIHRSGTYAEIEEFVKTYIAKNCTEAKEIQNGIYAITY
jgi:hypothetical protein